MTIIGICTKHSEENFNQLSYERYTLYQNAKFFYDHVILIDSRAVIYKFIRGANKPEISLYGQDLTNLDTLIVRGTKGRESSLALLGSSLNLCGCDIFDRPSTFSTVKASKLLTTLSRFRKQTGSDTFFAFNLEQSLILLEELRKENRFPLIAKPIAGRQGKGIMLLSGIDDAIVYVKTFFAERENEDEPLYLQKFVEFQEEYRILVVNGKSLGVVRKIKKEGSIVSNATQGSEFQKVNASDVVRFTLENVSHEGVLGVDVARDTSNDLHLIEANRAPLWETFEQAMNIDIAKIIIEQARLSLG